ncbi:MAG: hypothetical protein AB7L09_03045 [Nitrospira sp.]
MAKKRGKKKISTGRKSTKVDAAPEPPEAVAPVPVPSARPAPPPAPAVKPAPILYVCDYCQKKVKRAFVEDDPEWEPVGHPDRIQRNVCHGCADDVDARYDCAGLVFAAMRKSMTEKGMVAYEIENAVHIVWRTIHVQLDEKSFVKLANQLKVKHPWLSGR